VPACCGALTAFDEFGLIMIPSPGGSRIMIHIPEISQIGRYQINREIGRGAMGVVYLGFDPLLKRRIAVKTVLPGAATADQPWDVLLKRLTREAQAAASLSHPNIMVFTMSYLSPTGSPW